MSRRFRAAAVAGALVLVGLAPYYLDPDPLGTLGRILIAGLLAASLDLLVGIAGIPSLGHAAYFGIGAYTAGLLARDVTTFGPVLYFAAAGAGLLAAAATGWVVVRSRGVTLLMLTLVIGEIVRTLAHEWDSLTQGDSGLNDVPAFRVTPSGGGLTQPAEQYWYVFAGFVVGFAVLWSIRFSPFGHALRGIRENDERMHAVGFPVHGYAYAAFCVAGAVAGAAGSLVAAHGDPISPASAGFTASALALVAVIIGGSGSIWGPCVGAAIVLLDRQSLGVQLGGNGPLVLGLTFIAAVYVVPRGLAGIRVRLAKAR
jgi:branched-chain amino acid transport system permease protein